MATLREVAREAGVSVVTASRSLNGATTVRADCRRRVDAAAAHLGYRPNLLAKGLSRQCSHLVVAYMGELENPYFGQLAESLVRAFNGIGHEVVIANTSSRVIELAESLAAAACVLVSVGDKSMLASAAATGRAIGIACRRPDGRAPGFPNIDLDYDGAYGEILGALLAAGQRRFALLSPFVRQHEFLLDKKFGSLLARLRRARLRPVAPPGSRAFPSVSALAAAIDLHPGLADAVFCENDLLAVALQMRLQALGAHPPPPVIVGCDGILDLPAIWTVRLDTQAIAQAAVAAFQALPGGSSPPPIAATPVIRHLAPRQVIDQR